MSERRPPRTRAPKGPRLGTLRALLLTALFSALATATAQPGAAFVELVSALTRDITAAPGETQTVYIRVRNSGSQAAYVNVDFRDVAFDETGDYKSVSTGHARSSRDWLTGPSEPVLVPGGRTVDIPIEVTVPADAVGAYWTGVYVRPDTTLVQNWNINNRAAIPITVMTEYAGVFYTTILGTGENQVVFGEAYIVEDEDAHNWLQLSVRNDGDLADKFQVRAQLMSDDGALVQESVITARIIAGIERQLALPLGPIEPNAYTLIVTADSGRDQLFARQYRLTVP